MYRGRAPQAPLWSLANIRCVVADIMHSGTADILHGVAKILSVVPDIKHVQHQCLFWSLNL